MREAPQRMCVGCRRRRNKDELLRLSRTPQGIRFDPRQRLPGRGVYICPDPACIDAAARRDGRAVRRALRGPDEAEVTAALAAAAHSMTGAHDVAPKEQNA